MRAVGGADAVEDTRNCADGEDGQHEPGCDAGARNDGALPPITTSNPGKPHVWPTILPGGNGVLFTVWEGSPAAGTGQIAVVSLAARTERILVKGIGSRFFAGHVIFGREGSLWAVPFDERRLDVTGGAVPVLMGVAFTPQFGLGSHRCAKWIAGLFDR
jgi:hypothetical protein